ncbi:MAG TPA: TetR/AcrR family transcriptional regulator [Cytophagaceae bacterium]|jgi:TetR/AcrR family transcriptional regulator|nr:TetR/AcrR family transcriptional regulator [Cytophagaceae bacterium]
MSSQIRTTENTKLEVILNAAQKRFGRYGLAKTTMNEIALDIGMSKACLYYYFPDKNNLFQAVVKKEQDEFILEINKIMKNSVDGALLLKQYFKKRMFFFQRFLNLAKLKSEFLINNKPVCVKMFDDFRLKEVELVKAIIQIGINNKQFRKINIQEYSELLILLMQGIRMVAMKNKEVSDFNEEDYGNMERTMSKVVNMLIKDVEAN